MQRAATESLVKDPTAATTTINDDSDVTTVSLSADASVTEGENITYTATLTNPADGAVTVTLQWCNGSLSLMARLQEPRRFQQVMMYT
ncbi:hypothetical protein OK016_00075 [Vibrio chagasii]|nr:hypothetical protein [Vibrio chagasii]